MVSLTQEVSLDEEVIKPLAPVISIQTSHSAQSQYANKQLILLSKANDQRATAALLLEISI